MSYSLPMTLAEATSLAQREGNSVYIAGGTDLMVRRSLGLDSAQHLIDLSGIGELRGITINDETISIGAATTLAELAASPIIQSHFPALAQAALSIASPPIRNSATVAGNLLCENRCIYYDQSEFWQASAGGCLKCGAEVCIATGSTKKCYSVFISDLAPVLIALDASIEVFNHENTVDERSSTIPVERLYTGDGMNPHTISKRDILIRIILPVSGRDDLSPTPLLIKERGRGEVFFRKLRPRASVDFTNLTLAMRIVGDARHNKNGGITIAASGIGPAPAVLRDATSEDADVLTLTLLKQSQIIDNLSYRRPYRKEMLRETIAEGITTLRRVG